MRIRHGRARSRSASMRGSRASASRDLRAGAASAGARPDDRPRRAARVPRCDMRDERAQDAPRSVPRGAAAAHRVLDRPPRRRHSFPGAHARKLRGRLPHGRRHARVRRDVHEGPRARLPAFAERSRDDDQHPRDAACRNVRRSRFAPAELDASGRVRGARAPSAARASSRSPSSSRCAARSTRSIPAARTAEEFVADDSSAARRLRAWRRDAATLLTHAESIALFRSLGVTDDARAQGAERSDAVQRPHARAARRKAHRRVSRGRSRSGRRVPAIVRRSRLHYWIEHDPEFGRQAVLLDDANLLAQMPRARRLARYKSHGINIWGAPLFALARARCRRPHRRVASTRSPRGRRGSTSSRGRSSARAISPPAPRAFITGRSRRRSRAKAT